MFLKHRKNDVALNFETLNTKRYFCQIILIVVTGYAITFYLYSQF